MEKLRYTTEAEEEFYCKKLIPTIAGTRKGTLAIIGGGKNMWKELATFQEIGVEHDTMAVNVASMFIPDLDHIFSLHYKNISYVSNWRKVEYGHACKHICHSTNKPIDGVDHTWFPAMRSSTSGLMAITIGKLLGYSKFVLIGVPMDNSGYFYKPGTNHNFPDAKDSEIEWIKDSIKEVRSMSGRTRDILGSPTLEWLTGE